MDVHTAPHRAPEGAPAPASTEEPPPIVTRTAVLDAAADRLVDAGLAGVTLDGVAAALGTPVATVRRHVDTDLQLVLSLAAHLSDDGRATVIGSTDADAPIEERVAQMVDTILVQVFDPTIRAQFELHTAARVDPALAAQLGVLNAHNAKAYVTDLAVALLAANVDPVRVQASMELAVCASVGLSLLTISGTDPAVERRLAESLRAHLLAEIDAAPATPAEG